MRVFGWAYSGRCRTRVEPNQWRIGLRCIFAASLTMLVASQALAKPVPVLPCAAFAFPNRTGELLLAPADLPQPSRMTKVVCPGGRVLRVRYLRQQNGRDGGSGRQISSEFENEAGAVFRVVGATVDEYATYLLAVDSLLVGASVEPLSRVDSVSACSAADQERLGVLRGRPVVHCWPLARVGVNLQVLLLEFERRGKDALASLLLLGPGIAAFEDYPAEYRGEGEDLWRVDDLGEMSPEGFKILFALRTAHTQVLGVSWASTESLSLSLLVSRDGRHFEELVQGNRYVAPE